MALASSFGAHFHTLFPLDSSLPPASPYASCLGPRSLAQSPPRPRLANHSPVPPQSSQRGAPPTDFEKKRFLTNIFSRNQYNQAFLSLLTLQTNSVYCESEQQSIFCREKKQVLFAGRSRKKIAKFWNFGSLVRIAVKISPIQHALECWYTRGEWF